MSQQSTERVDGNLSSRGHATTGALNYLSANVQSSLYRNGAVLIRRNAQGSDDGAKGLDLDERVAQIFDARELSGADRRTVHANGFELIDCPLDKPKLDFFDQDQVVGAYYPECAAAVAAATGARAFAFDHNVRSASGKETATKIKGGQEVQGPAHVVHGDYTLTSGPQRLRDLANPPSLNDTYRNHLAKGETLIAASTVEQALSKGGRFAIINVWRNIAEEPVVTHPMAFCDGRTVGPEDLVVFEIHYQDRIGENYFAKFADPHRWYTYPQARKAEAILIKQWDSSGTLAATDGAESDGSVADAPCSFSFHSAFKDPQTPPNAPDRWSIEVRCLVIYD
jgi:hypothetical protein